LATLKQEHISMLDHMSFPIKEHVESRDPGLNTEGVNWKQTQKGNRQQGEEHKEGTSTEVKGTLCKDTGSGTSLIMHGKEWFNMPREIVL